VIHPVDLLLKNIGARVVIQQQEIMIEGGARVQLEENGRMISINLSNHPISTNLSNHLKVHQVVVKARVGGAHPKVQNSNNNETTMIQEVCTAVVVQQRRVLVAA